MKKRYYHFKHGEAVRKHCILAEHPSQKKVVDFTNNDLLRSKDARWFFQKSSSDFQRQIWM
jgi:hypothetical protein